MELENLTALNTGLIHIVKKARGEDPRDWAYASTFDLTVARIGADFFVNGMAGSYPLNLEYNTNSRILKMTLVTEHTISWNHVIDSKCRVVFDESTLYITWLVAVPSNRQALRIMPDSRLMLKVS